MIITYAEALKELIPGVQFVIKGNSYEDLVLVDENLTKPTQQELEDKIAELQADFDAKGYQRQRAVNYPQIGNQLDMLWHAIDSGTLNKTSDFYTAIKAVKDAYPKSE